MLFRSFTELSNLEISQPSFCSASSINKVSRANRGFLILETSSPKAAKTKARFVADLEPGIEIFEFIA